MIIFCIMVWFLVVWLIIHKARASLQRSRILANKNDLDALFAARDKEDAALEIQDYASAAYHWQECQDICKRLDERKV